MRENICMFKEWYKLAKPHKGYWAFQFVTVAIPSICSLSEAMYAAKVTTSLADGNYKMAIFSLCLVLFFVFLRAFSMDLNYRNTMNLVGYTYKNVQEKIFEYIVNGKEKNFLYNSKEKLINIFHNDVYDVSKFSDIVCSKFRYLFLVILTIFYVFSVNLVIGFIVIGVVILNYLIMDKLNNSISKANKLVKEATDEEFVVFSEVIDSKNMLEDLNITKKIKDKFYKSNVAFLNEKHNYTVKASYLDNYFFMFYKTIIFIGTLFMMFILSQDLVNLTVYLVIVSYLTDSITNSKDFLNILTELKNTYVATNRVNIILNFDEKEKLDFGSINKDDIKGEIDFVKVFYKPKSDDIGLTELNNVSFSISSNQIVLFHGSRNSGKRTIFYLLRRIMKPDQGSIYIDKIQIEDFNKNVYKTNINYLTTKPYFYGGTVISNLKLVKNNLNKIYDACKMAGVYDEIMKRKDGFKTDINELTMKELYLLSFARMLLMESEIIVLYEFPSYLSQKDEKNVMDVLNKMKNKKTILIFSANKNCQEIVDVVYSIDKGALTRV